MAGESKAGRSGGGRGRYNNNRSHNKEKVQSEKLIASLREACPKHKLRDLEGLVKSLRGDEEKIRQRIQEWWEEPAQPVEEEWADVNKQNNKKKQSQAKGGGGGRRGDRSEGRGRGGRGREGRGGRGTRDRRRGRGDRGDNKEGGEQQQQQTVEKTEGLKVESTPVGVPPVREVRAPQGAWAKKSSADPVDGAVEGSADAAAVRDDPPPVSSVIVSPVPVPSPVAPAVTPQPSQQQSQPIGTAAAIPSRNVWATKGSAHLIQAEKQPPPAPPAPIARKAEEKLNDTEQQQHPSPEKSSAPPKPKNGSSGMAPEQSITPTTTTPTTTSTAAGVENTGKDAASNNAWGSKSVSSIVAPDEPIDIPASPGVLGGGVMPSVSAVVKESPPKRVPPPASSDVLMGHWETGDQDDSANLDFGFGSFGAQDMPDASAKDKGAAPAVAPAPSQPQASAATASASPARPPPGLGIGGMPPMPANAVLVHELENKLEEASLSKQAPTAQHPPMAPEKQANGDVTSATTMPSGQPTAYNQAQYGINSAGMTPYNYATAPGGNAFVAAPVLGAVPSHPQQKELHAGLYGADAAQSAPSSGDAAGATSAPAATDAQGASGPAPNAAAGMQPPGMANMPYGVNPALYYGQQFHMGQHQGGAIGYNYGGYNAQFGGVQGNFAYPQPGMGAQGGAATGYGHAAAPGAPYDDHHSAGQHGGSKSGGYRGGGGRNAHHSNSYGAPTTSQYHAAGPLNNYGGQPYGIGYHGGADHFNQAAQHSPYGIPQQQQQQSNYGDYKGNRKSNRGAGGPSSFHHPQNGPQPPLSQQSFGLQGQQNATGGDSNNNRAGWNSNQAGQGGWSGGGPSTWQGNK